MDIPFLDALTHGGMTGDGAMGSLLYERGIFVNRNFDEVNLSQPELVYTIHHDYLHAGAHLLETNTYGANRIRLLRHGLADKVGEINRAAVNILKRVADGTAYLGGSIGPTGLPFQDVRQQADAITAAYHEQAQILTQEGCDVLVIETFHDPFELGLAIRAARAVTSLPIIAHVAVNDHGQISDGTPPAEMARLMHSWGADVVGANCNGPEVIFDVVSKMVPTGIPISAMPNAGLPQKIEDRQIYLATPENFGVYARRLFKAGVKLVGGCCGTSPAHIARVSSAARMITPRQRPSSPHVETITTHQPPVPLAQRSGFGAKLGKQFVVSVEVNPAPGLSVDSAIAAARMLVQHGADVINIADGPRATVRMSNLALALKMQSTLGIETLLHVCCRDRNLLGLQSFTLGAHVLGIRNLVVITGDPPKIGDYPDATAVYDMDSIGLLRMIQGYNCAVDPAGKAMDQTAFVLATGAEPGAADFAREMMRLKQKVNAGANVIMTQPIYDPHHLDRFLDASQELNVPILMGLLPLASYRNAEFIHNHIPGMQIPESIRERMRKAGKGDAARAEGVAITIEALEGVRDRVAGVYIMPPLERYDMAAAILDAIGPDRSIRNR